MLNLYVFVIVDATCVGDMLPSNSNRYCFIWKDRVDLNRDLNQSDLNPGAFPQRSKCV